MSTPSSDQLTVIFDGTCGFCTAIRSRIEPRDHHRRLAWVPCQALSGQVVDRATCETTIITITPGGAVDTGAQAAARILSTLTGSP